MNKRIEHILNHRFAVPIILLLSFISMLVFIQLNLDHEGGEDNISLFLLSRFGPYHLNDLFASPIKILFTMIMSVPAQLGFKAVQITNAILACATAWFGLKILNNMGIKENWLAVSLIIFSPIYYIISLTALSEILFSFALTGCILLIYNKKYMLSALLLSFLPFIRSEGYVLILVFLTFFIIEKQWKILPLLLIGTIVFSIAGYPFHHDYLWVFHKNYGDASNIYGHGELLHFVKNSRWINGPILTVLLPFSLVMILFKLKTAFSKEKAFTLLIAGCYFGFLLLHSYLWWQGKGASIGLIRVMACVMPLGGIIGVWTLSQLRKYMMGFSIYIFIVVALVHILTGFRINKLPRGEDVEHAVVNQLYERSKSLVEKAPQVKFTSFYYGFLSGKDTYDPKNGNCWTINSASLDSLKPGSLVQYETHFGPNECGIDTDYFDRERSDLQKVLEIYPKERFNVLNGYEYKNVLYIKK